MSARGTPCRCRGALLAPPPAHMRRAIGRTLDDWRVLAAKRIPNTPDVHLCRCPGCGNTIRVGRIRVPVGPHGGGKYSTIRSCPNCHRGVNAIRSEEGRIVWL